MSAASFLGISALVYSSGYYGLIYSIGFLVGWPIIMFLMAEPLRNLGRYTFADVASYRLQATPIRAMAATRNAGHGRLLPDRADGRRRPAHRAAVRSALSRRSRPGRRADDHLRHLRRHDRHHLGADHQGGAAADRRDRSWRSWCSRTSASTSTPCSSRRSRSIRKHDKIMLPGAVGRQPDLGDLARHGADVRHRRSAAHPHALLHRRQRQGSAQVGVLGDHASSATSTS